MAEDEPWIMAGGRRMTHADLRRRAGRAASGFAALRVAEGDAVGILLGNGTPFLEASLGASLLGAVPVPVDPCAGADHVAFVLGDCGARLAVAKAGAAVPPGLPLVGVDDVEGWERWADRHPPLLRSAAAAPSALIYTSGSTGRPKGVRRAPAPPGERPARALRVYGFDRPGRAVALVDGPLSHSVPNAYARVALGAGADLVLRPGFDPEATLEAIERHRVTHMHLPPSAMARLLALPERVRAARDLSSLVHVAHGGAPCPTHLRRAMRDWLGPVLNEYYGSTETGLLTFRPAGEALGGVGRPLPGIALHVLDPEGRALAPGAVGTIYAGSATLHRFAYMNDPDRRAAVGRGDLVTAGDLGWLDRDGALHLAGRAVDALTVGGVAVHPARVEAALSALPGVADCAALGVSGPDGDELVACAEPLPGAALDGEALRAALAARLPPEAVPRRVLIVDRLPREATGKMLRPRLRAVVAATAAGSPAFPDPDSPTTGST